MADPNYLVPYAMPSTMPPVNTMTGHAVRREPPREPSVSAYPTTPSERGVTNHLIEIGVDPRYAGPAGTLASFTPPGAAYDAGQMIGQGVEERNPLMIGGGTAMAIFAGPMARTANIPMLRQAQRMHAAGRARDDIWNETGWFQGRDGQWRWEIDDSGMSVGMGAQTGVRGQAVSHPDLAAAYPGLDDLPVEVRTTGMGQGTAFYDPRSSPRGPGIVVRGYPEHHRGGLAHEFQHAVDDLENRLGSPRYASPAEAYQSIEEVMARNTQLRAGLNSQERRARPPWVTQGIPDNQQIVRRR